MAGHSVGTIFAELDLDASRYMKSQQKLLKDATSTTLNIEENFKKLGIKSSAEFDLMRQKASNAYERIKNSAQATANDIIRAERAKADQINRINEQQFGKQTSFLSNLKSHWLATTAVIAAATGAAVQAWNMAKAGAAYDEQRGMLDNLAAKYQATADTIVEEMDRASKFQIAKAELMQIALAGVSKGLNPEQLINLADAAETLGDAVGKDATTALKELTEALETGRTKGLKNYLGTALDLEATFGDLTSKLTEAEKAQAMYNIIMKAHIDLQNQQTKAIDKGADSIAQVEKKFADATLAAERFFKVLVVGLIDAKQNMPKAFGAGLMLESEIAMGGPITFGERPGADYAAPPEVKSTASYQASLDAIKKQVEARKEAKTEIDKTKREYEATLKEIESMHAASVKTLGLEYPNQSKVLEQELENRAKDEKDAAEDRMKLYRKMGEDEEKVWAVQTKDYKKELDKRDEFAIQSARNMQDAMSDFFFDAMSGDLRTFGDYWGSFWGSMKRVMANALSEMALTWASSELKGLFNTAGGSGSILGAIGAGLGTAWTAVSDYATDAFDWATSLFMHEGGLVGKDKGSKLKSDEYMAVLQRGEYVIPRELAERLGLSGPGATPGIEGPIGGSLSKGQAIALASLAITGPMAAAGIASLSIPGLVLGIAKGIKGALTVMGIIDRGEEAMSPYAPGPPGTYGGASGNIGSGFAVGTGEYGGYEGAIGAAAAAAAAAAIGDYGGYEGAIGAAAAAAAAAAIGDYGGALGTGGYGFYATGGIVPRDQIAKVHKGEGVFTPDQMKHLKAGGSETIVIYNVMDGEVISRNVLNRSYDASSRGGMRVHERAIRGYAATAGIDI